MRITHLALVAAIGLATASTPAAAQVCSQPSPGVAQIHTNGIAVTIHVAGASVPRVNGVSCGFSATMIDIIGVTTTDDVTLNFVPPTIPVRAELGNNGPNALTIFGSNNNDTIVCGATSVDRDGDSTADLDLSLSEITILSINTRTGDDVVDCSAAGYPVGLIGGGGIDSLEGGPFADSINGGPDADVLIGGGGNDAFAAQANDGNDSITGDGGNDEVNYSTRATPVIVGGPGAEDAISDDTEVIRGGKAADVIDFSAGVGPHDLYGGAGHDTLIGGAGADRLYGQAGNDTLQGGAGLDLINAAAGNDSIGASDDGSVEVVNCGAGSDTYVTNTEDSFVACEVPTAAPRVIGEDESFEDDLESDAELELDPELDPEATGGCSAAGGSAGPTTILMIGLALLGCSRRRRGSSRR